MAGERAALRRDPQAPAAPPIKQGAGSGTPAGPGRSDARQLGNSVIAARSRSGDSDDLSPEGNVASREIDPTTLDKPAAADIKVEAPESIGTAQDDSIHRAGFGSLPLIRLIDGRMLSSREGPHVTTASLPRAFQWGRNLFGGTGFAVLEPIGAKGRKRFIVVAFDDVVSVATLGGAVRQAHVSDDNQVSVAVHAGPQAEAKDLYGKVKKGIERRGATQLGKEAVAAAAKGTPPDWRTVKPKTDLDADANVGIAGRAHDFVPLAEYTMVAGVTSDRVPFVSLEPGVFWTLGRVKAALGAARLDREDVRAASAMLLGTSATKRVPDRDELMRMDQAAFEVATWEERVTYLRLLIEGYTGEDAERAIIQIFRATRNETELDAIFAELRRGELGRKVFNDLSADGAFELLQVLGELKGGTEVGPAFFRMLVGQVFGASLLSEPGRAAQGTADWIVSNLKGIWSMLSRPDELFEGLAHTPEFVGLILRFRDRDKEAMETVDRLLRQVGKKLSTAAVGAEYAEHLGLAYSARAKTGATIGGDLIGRVRWALALEVMSMFIGLGEAKAVVAGVKSGEVSKSVLAVLARLGRFARIGRAAEAAAEAARLERTLVALSAMAGFTEEARAARLVEHLADRELASLARIAERAKLAEGAGADALRVAVRADRVLAKETDDLTSALQLLGHFEDKLGGTIGPEAAAGIRHMLENSSWSWERRLRLADRVPAENAEEFLRALRKVEPRQFRSWGSAVFEGIAERPKGIRFLGEVGGEIYESAFNRTGASWPSFERFIDGVAIRKAELDNPAEYQKLLDRLARHDATAFEDVLGARLRSITARGPSAESEKLLAAAVGDTGDAVRRLTPEARRAARIAADASPELVDRALKAETELFERTLGELDASLTNAGMPKEDVEKTLQAVRDLNREHNQLRGQQQIREMILRVEKLADPFPLRWSVEERIDHFRSRARSLREANPRRAGELDAEARRLEKLRTPGGPLYDAEALQREVKKSVYLMRGVQGGEEELRRLWVQYWTRRKEPKSGFAQYAERIYRSHHVGMVGEYEVAFRKGEQLILLKAPDGMVTIGGTDMVAIERATGNVLLIDNKALSAGQVDKVDALVRNLRGNVKSDLQTFAAASRDGKLPSQVDGAISRLRDASNEIEAKYGRMSRKEFEANTTVQKDVTDILRRHGVRRVVTNAGGEVSGLSQELADIGFELDDLNL